MVLVTVKDKEETHLKSERDDGIGCFREGMTLDTGHLAQFARAMARARCMSYFP